MLVTCQSCAQQISDKASSCPKCKAIGDEAFGAPAPCRECGNPIRPSALSCEGCGAPVVVALGGEAPEASAHASAPKAVEREQVSAHQPAIPSSGKARRGFARGTFGKAMAYVLFIFGALGLMMVIGNWLSYGQYLETPSYFVGQIVAMSVIVGASIRAIAPRRMRMLLDWFLGIPLLLVGALATFAFASTLTAPVANIGGLLFYLVVSGTYVASSFTVAVRLLRDPYYERSSGEMTDQPSST